MKAPSLLPVTRNDAAAVAILIGAVLLLFGDVLVATDSRVVSHLSGDTSQFFTRMRAFGFGEIRQGRLPLWNPYLMSGTPFLGNFQSALFYPFNGMYAILPVERATNMDYALHFFLGGLFLFAWCRGRGMSAVGATIAGLVYIGSAPFSLRLLAGHLTMVQSMAWAPLVLLAVDKVFDAGEHGYRRTGWVLLGIAAATLQILAGHPQTVFITGFTIAAYCGLRIIDATQRIRTAGALMCIGVGPLFLAAIQLLPGLQTMSESLRSGGTDRDFATSFSFPPENLVTLVAPAFFSDRVHAQYWGSWAFWDACLFMGVTALALAFIGARHTHFRQRRSAPFLAFFFLLLAMGRYTPVYDVFALIPVFSVLRGTSKFLFAVMLFMSLLVGLGYDRIRSSDLVLARRGLGAVLVASATALGLAVVAVALAARPPYETSPWRELLFRQLRFNYFGESFYVASSDYFLATSRIAMISLGIGSFTCIVAASLFWNLNRSRAFALALGILAVADVLAFARVYRVTFDHDRLNHPEAEAVYTKNPGDYRVLLLAGEDVWMRNHSMLARQSAIWGYEPVMLNRYGTLMARAAGGDFPHLVEMKAHARFGSDIFEIGLKTAYIDFRESQNAGTVELPAPLDIARCRYVIVPDDVGDTTPGVYENPEALPRFLLLRDYVVLQQQEGALEALGDATFDPRRTVILEEPPEPAPVPGSDDAVGNVTLEAESSDHMVLRIKVHEPAILLITDPYSEGWRIDALPDSVQQSYRLMPADFAFRGVALEAGSHHFRLEYLPDAFILGRAISLGSLGIYVVAIGLWVMQYHRAKKAR